MKQLYSVKDLTDILKKSRQQIALDIKKGKIKAQKVGKAYVITQSEVDRIKEV